MRRIFTWTLFFMLSECCVGTGNPVAGEDAAGTSAGTDYSGGKAGNMEAD